MYLRIIIGLIIAGMGGALWFTIDANAATRVQLEQEKARSESLAKAVAGIGEEMYKRLNSQKEAYSVRDSRRETAASRRQAAEEQYRLAEADAWGGSPVPDAVTDSLCLKPGSCIGYLPGAAGTAGGPDEADAGDATERQLRLDNESLRTGVEDLRRDLALCNADKAGMCAWCRKQYGDRCQCEVKL